MALVDDQELIRAGLAMVIDGSDDMRVVVQAADGEQALAALRLGALGPHRADVGG
ncbi:MAG: DNA-binding response regulator, partial [Pseudonocardiales bacterium]